MGTFVLLTVGFIFILLPSATNGHFFGGSRHRQLKTLSLEKRHVEQPISHFENLGKTWKQMYYEDYSLHPNHKGLKNNVAFLSIGGEAENGCMFGEMMREWAELYNASQFCLEHRYYGSSRPFPEQTVENLKYLSSREMIGDLKYFIEYINKKNEWIGTKWIVFGGSYPGLLAAWMRQIHPETVVGAVSSSAPLDIRVVIYQYNQVVEKWLNSSKANPYCISQFKQAFSEVSLLLRTNKGRDQLTETLKLTPSLNRADLSHSDVQNFYYHMILNIQLGIQYSINGSDHSFDGMCKIMKEAPRPLDGLIEIANLQWDFFGSPFVNNYTASIEYMRDPTYKDGRTAAFRSWTWQTCTELGAFQTTGYSESIFGTTQPLSFWINQCMDIFGEEFDADFIRKAIKETNQYYGGVDGYNGTNVVLINGDVDPYSALGRYRSDHYSQVTYLVKGAYHCQDMDDQGNRTTIFDEVHKLTAYHINNWINGPPQIPNTNLSNLKNDENEDEKRRIMDRFPQSFRPFKSQKVIFDKPIKIEDLKVNRKNDRFTHRPRMEFDFSNTDLSKLDLSMINTTFFTQPVSHYDNKMIDTFQQKWWINKKYARPNGPRFLMLGGEEPTIPYFITDEKTMTWMGYGAEYGATLYMNQHRCYEDKKSPKRDFDLRYCNAWEALGDIKLFIETINYQENTTGPWILFGGSYPGMLALWARDKFPDLILGSVGSSAPVYFKMDYFEYLELKDHEFKKYNQSCYSFLQTGYKEIGQLMLSNQGLAKLSTMINLNPKWNESSPINPKDLAEFVYHSAIIYYNQMSGPISTDFICDLIKKNDDPLEFLTQNVLLTNNYSRSVQNAQGGGWFYQQCKEFGFFQTVDYGHGLYAYTSPINYFLGLCQDAYGISTTNHLAEDFSTTSIQEYIDDTYAFFMSTFNATNIVAPNGSFDPWKPAGLLEPINDHQLIILMIGTAHCQDMFKTSSDQKELEMAQKRIGDEIGKWLSQKRN